MPNRPPLLPQTLVFVFRSVMIKLLVLLADLEQREYELPMLLVANT